MKRSCRVYFIRDAGGLLTGLLMPRTSTRLRISATGPSEESVLEQLDAELSTRIGDDLEAFESFLWLADVRTANVTVEVRPQTTVGKRRIIGKNKIPIEVTYAWAAVSDGKRGDPAGYRVMVPRFGWTFVLEELGMAPEVLRQAIGTDLTGESSGSLFGFREATREYVSTWTPKAHRKRKLHAEDELYDEFPHLRQIAENWGVLSRAGKLGRHFGTTDSASYDAVLTPERKTSVLLVGPSGVGKTEWVRELARRAARTSEGGAFDGVQVWATSAERIMAGMTYLGMWEERCLNVVEELRDEGHFLYVDRLSALARERSGASSIADLMLPAVRNGEIALIAESTFEEYQRLQVVAPALLACFRVVRLEPTTPEATAALVTEYQERHHSPSRLHPDATRRLLRYLAFFRKDVAFPGKALLFLDWLEKQAPTSRATPARTRTVSGRDADHLFSRYSGLPEKLLSDDETGDADSLSVELQAGVVGQDSACRLAAQVLARFKAGVNDPEKPIGSLLFVGPTGVGKTELAKQLARFMFGSDERLIRLDMSEYMLADSTGRLLADEKGSSSLAQRVSRNPLSLVLLDEIEKAHPAVFDLLLGVLGEGRMTSLGGRLVDFRMALIVMTSNLGSGASRAGFGQQSRDPEQSLRAVKQHFRPEFFNRIDDVVPFLEISADALRLIVELELEKVREREGLRRRNLTVEVDDAAKSRLAELGYDPEYGARPLKRAIEEHVITPIAIELSRQPKLADRTIRVTTSETGLRVLM